MGSERIRLFDEVSLEAKRVKSRFRNDQLGRDALWDFLRANHWFGVEHGGIGQDAWIVSIAPMKSALDLWLRAYGQSREKKIDLMLEVYTPSLPRTCRKFCDYMRANDCQGRKSTLNLLDFLLYYLDKEIDEYDSEALSRLLIQANQELTKSAVYQLTEFLRDVSDEIWIYQFYNRRVADSTKIAYTQKQFSIMAYTIFNEESWKEHSLIQKAIEKRKYAEIWLFTAMHFVCAIRREDIFRLPIPSLPYPSQEIRGRISRGLFTRQEARSISEELMYRMDMSPAKPGKTGRNNPPYLKLFIPESLLEPMGVILALALSHREANDPFLRRKQLFFRDIRDFFGEEFANAAENRGFLSRKANKAYLQGIEMSAGGEGESGAKGYMLAALARSHKGGIGRLPETTDVYLRDASFSGCSPAFILREMFERGVFGFIPALLLHHYMGKAYTELNVQGQTQLIKSIGLDAMQLEAITSSVTQSFQKATEIVKCLLLEQSGKQSALERVLQNIAAGAAPSRQQELLCLRTAAGYSCCEPERSGCLGCRYEIYTKSAMHLLVKEYVRLNREKETSDAFLRERLKNILEKGILPAITEILTSLPMLYPGAEMESFYKIMERGIINADCSAD